MVILFIGAWIAFGAVFYFVGFRHHHERQSLQKDERWDAGL
jgi:hypothetical protein